MGLRANVTPCPFSKPGYVGAGEGKTVCRSIPKRGWSSTAYHVESVKTPLRLHMSAPARTLAEGVAALRILLDSMRQQGLDLNEADTRHRFIDGLIHDCLGWDRNHTHLERHFAGDFSDYELGSPPQVVVEAKRAGVSFELPSEGTDSIVRSLRSLSKNSPNFKAAFDQAAKYCGRSRNSDRRGGKLHANCGFSRSPRGWHSSERREVPRVQWLRPSGKELPSTLASDFA